MRIILNADGFGRDEDTFQATVECFQAGALSSATIDTDAPGAKLALDYAIKHPEFSFGIHIAPPHDGRSLKPIESQIEAVQNLGIPVSHLAFDDDQVPPERLLRELGKIAYPFKIKRLRSVTDTFPHQAPPMLKRWANRIGRRRVRNHFITTDRLCIVRSIDDARAMHEWMPPMLDASIEIGFQPGQSDERANAHRQAVQSFARRAVEAGHHLITWNQL